MKFKNLLLLIVLLSIGITGNMTARTVKAKVIETSDVHGNFYPYDFINQRAGNGSLARVATLIEEQRRQLPDRNIIIVDNGDILQGQPSAYYYNFIDTVNPHVGAEMLRWMGYDALTLGNHDIETGHAVYDRWIREVEIPVLGANIIDTATGEPYVAPYHVFEIDGVKIAILGMITPGIPGWLPETLWKGLRFDDMVETARKWVPVIQEKENPHVIVGMFHSGRDSTKFVGGIPENQSLSVAEQVPGFNAVLMGHDHSVFMDFVNDPQGRKVLAANPANNANRVIILDIEVEVDDDNKLVDVTITGDAKSTASYEPSAEFLAQFQPQRQAVEEFVGRTIGTLTDTLTTHDAFFGPSAFIDFIHEMQMAISGAEISMAAPLTFNAVLPAGPVTVADMFNLYKYENMLYTMRLTGQEIKDYLELSYDMWTNRMSSPDDHLLKIRDTSSTDMTHTGFIYPSYNFDSAAGIIYTVDVTKPRGEKITIVSMADGSPFLPDKDYTVAINSYRGNGGGNLLTDGAGIPKIELSSRILTSTDKDLRYYLMKYIEEKGTVQPKKLDQWKFVPEDMVAGASSRDKALLFPND